MRQQPPGAFVMPMDPFGKGTKWVIGITAISFLIQHVILQQFFQSGGAGTLTTPARMAGQGMLLFSLSDDVLTRGFVWQLWTYALLHDGFLHVVLNMLIVAFMGREIEYHFGLRSFVTLYVLSSALAGLGWLAFGGFGSGYCIGASGAAFGLIGAFAAAFPKREITLMLMLVIPVTMTGRMLAVLAAGTSLVLMMGHGGDVAHSAHLAGCVAGYLLARFWLIAEPARPTAAHRAARRSNLRVMPYEEPEVESWQRESDAGPAPFTDEDVDRILEKISAKGLRSLSKGERQILEEASKR